jgi:hypothetical protein
VHELRTSVNERISTLKNVRNRFRLAGAKRGEVEVRAQHGVKIDFGHVVWMAFHGKGFLTLTVDVSQVYQHKSDLPQNSR